MSKITQRLGVLPQNRPCDTFELQFLCKQNLLLVQVPYRLAKSWLRIRLHSLLQSEFSSEYMGRLRNELINAAGLRRLFFQT